MAYVYQCNHCGSVMQQDKEVFCTVLIDEEELHFCSRKCLAKWTGYLAATA